ncbi:MAG: hypothetical protein AAF202_02910, partial [Pseudomonadota bacterium]
TPQLGGPHTNAMYSIIHARLNTHRIYRKLKSSNSFDRFRLQLAMEAIQCPQSQLQNLVPQIDLTLDDGSELAKYVNGPLRTRGGTSGLHDGYRRLGYVATLLGLRQVDWSLRFLPDLERESFPNYHHGMWHSVHYVLDQILDDLETEIPEIAPYNIRINWFAHQFGQNLMCVDDIAEKYWPSNERNEALCQVLSERQDELGLPRPLSDKEILESRALLQKSHFHQRVLYEGPPSVEVGERVLSKTCSQCHNGQVINYDFSEVSKIKAVLQSSGEGFVGLVDSQLGTSESCQMPMKAAGPCLSESEKSSVIMYLRGLM